MNRKLALLPVISLALLVTAGCGNDAKKAKIDSFTATPSIVPTEGGPTTLVWDVRNADSIEIHPDVGAVTGTSLTINVTQTTTFELIAKREGNRSRKRTTVTLREPDMVVGSLRTMVDGTPFPDAVIVIDGHDAVVTDENGQFAVANVSTPYRLVVVFPQDNLFVVYDGLTRFDPVIDMPFGADLATFARNVPISGVVAQAVSASHTTTVTVDSPYAMNLGGTSASTSDGTYDTSVNWANGPEAGNVRLHALRYTNATPIDSYLYGSSTIAVEDGVAQTNVNLTMTSAGVATTQFIYDNFDLYQPVEGVASTMFGTPTGTAVDEGFTLPTDALSLTTTGVLAAAPDLEGTSLTFGLGYVPMSGPVYGIGFDIQTVPTGTATVQTTLRQPPWNLLPVDEGTVSPEDATFVINSPADAGVIWFFSVEGGPVDQFVMVVDHGMSTTLPDLRALGLDYDSYDAINWFTVSVSPRGSVDDLAGPGGILGSSPEFIGITFDSTVNLD